MLSGDFYYIHDLQQNDNELSCRISFNAAHAIFNGHFPHEPVVPGVCMIEIVRELLESVTEKYLFLRNGDNVKFLQLITPEVSPGVKITWKEQEDGYRVNAVFNSETTAYFKLIALYGE